MIRCKQIYGADNDEDNGDDGDNNDDDDGDLDWLVSNWPVENQTFEQPFVLRINCYLKL